MDLKSRVIKVVKQTENKYLNLYEFQAKRRNGKVAPYFVSSRATDVEQLKAVSDTEQPDGVIIYGVYGEKKDKLVLVKQFRYPFSEITTEVPAGKLEYGEAHYDCGKRELLEETGFNCSEYVFLGELYPTPAYNTEIIYMYLAKGLVQDKQNLDEDEFIDVVKIPLEKAVDMVMNNEIKDGKTKLIILMAARILGI